MSISHWGFFPGVWTASVPSYSYIGSLATWNPCDFDYLVQWMSPSDLNGLARQYMAGGGQA